MSRKKSTTLGKKIRTSRRDIGLSQKDLAKRLKISDKTVSSYEVGRATPSFQLISRISKVVHKPISYFDDATDATDLDVQIKIKTIEKELLEIKRLLKKKP